MKLLRYVTHDKVPAFEAQGWRNLGPLVGHMGIYSVLMEWPHQHEPPEPPQ
jgi:hypothetical protein